MEERSIIGKIGIVVMCIIATTLFSAEIPKEVKALAGTYKGEWGMFGIDESGNVVKKMSWTDTVVASNPVVQDGRAYVTVIDTMVFAGMGPQKMEGREGYYLNGDGSLGDYFFETGGQIHRMKKLDDHVWVYTVTANPYEMGMLGFANVIDSHHVMIKVVSEEDGMETHRISRLTTVSWKDAKGNVQRKQYVSLQGIHRHIE